MDFESYLKQHYAPATAARYLREAEHFFLSLESPQKAHYQDIMRYIEYQRTRYKSSSAVATSLYAVKAWYAWLSETHQIEANPAKTIYLKDKRSDDIQLQELLTAAELRRLLERPERYAALKTRNRAIIGLMIFQALRPSEIVRLTAQHIDLQTAHIHVLADRRTNARSLQLLPEQILNLHQHLPPYELKTDAIAHLVTSQQIRFQKKLNPTTVRQSVITNWLRSGMDLRRAQYQAGHKYPSTTERYRQTGIEELKAAVAKFHPLQ